MLYRLVQTLVRQKDKKNNSTFLSLSLPNTQYDTRYELEISVNSCVVVRELAYFLIKLDIHVIIVKNNK